MKRIDVLYEDGDCVMLNKPAGLAVQGGEGVKTSLDDLLYREWGRRPFLVHRLDKDTSGVLVVAKTSDAARSYGDLFKSGKVKKIYFAVCAGRPKEKKGTIEAELDIRGSLKEARTHYRLLASNGEFSFLELGLETGRMHQLRRHLARISLPVLGDDKYGSFPLNKKYRRELGLKRLLLHAGRVEIREKKGGRVVSAPLPDCFNVFIEKLPLIDLPN